MSAAHKVITLLLGLLASASALSLASPATRPAVVGRSHTANMLVPGALRVPLVASVAAGAGLCWRRERGLRMDRDNQLTSLRDEVAVFEARTKALGDEAAAFQAGQTKAEKSLAKATDEVTAIGAKLKEAEKAARAARDERTKAEREAREQLRATEEACASKERLEADAKDLRSKLEAADKELQAATASAAAAQADAECSVEQQSAAEMAAETLRAEIEGLKAQLETATVAVAVAEDKVAATATEVKAAEALRAEINGSKAELEKATAAAAAAAEKAAAAEEEAKQAEALRAEIEGLKAELQKATAAAAAAEEKAAAAEAEAAAAAAAAEEKAKGEGTEAEKLFGEVQALKEELKAAQAQAANATAEMAEAEEKMAAATEEVKAAQEKAAAAAEEVAAAETAAEALLTEIGGFKAELENATATAAAAEEKAAAAAAANAELLSGDTIPQAPVLAVASRLAASVSAQRETAATLLDELEASRNALEASHTAALEKLSKAHASGIVNGVRISSVAALATAQSQVERQRARVAKWGGADEKALESYNPFERFAAWREAEEMAEISASLASTEEKLPELQAAATQALEAAAEELGALEMAQAGEITALEAESPMEAIAEARASHALLCALESQVLKETDALGALCQPASEGAA